MSNTVQLHPRHVDPRELRNWVPQAIDLVVRGWFAWLSMATLLCGAVYFTSASQPMSWLIVMLASCMGTSLAATLDSHRRLATHEILSEAIRAVRSAVIYAVVIVAVAYSLQTLFGLIFFADSGKPIFALVPLSRSDWFHVLRVALGTSGLSYVVAYVCISIVQAPFQYHLIALLGVNWRTAWRLGDGGDTNFAVIICLGLVVILVGWIISLLVPLAVPFYFAFAPALNYVAFRDIYLGVSKNRELCLVEQRGHFSTT